MIDTLRVERNKVRMSSHITSSLYLFQNHSVATISQFITYAYRQMCALLVQFQLFKTATCHQSTE